jgi:hypothetical protein
MPDRARGIGSLPRYRYAHREVAMTTPVEMRLEQKPWRDRRPKVDVGPLTSAAMGPTWSDVNCGADVAQAAGMQQYGPERELSIVKPTERRLSS